MIYLKKEELKDAYYEAERASQDWYKPFNEYERIAGNKLSKSLGKNMPRVNDGSLAASLIETPMNVLPTMMSGKFTADNRKEAWLNEIANIIWKTQIVPNANTQASFFDKEQIALYRTLKYGAQPRYNFFVNTENYVGSDWSLPYIRNVKLEPGKFSVEDCDYVFLDIYFTKMQLKRIIETAGEDSEGGWKVEQLKKLADMSMTSKQMEEQNINERDKQINASGIKVTACFNRGKGAPFYMFSPHLEAGVCLREWTNPDPTGDLPITMQYCFENLENPYGIGRVELAGPTQNVLDYMTQAHVLATQLGLQPVTTVAGPTDAVNLSSFTHTPNALWMTGNAKVDIMSNTNTVYSQFPSNFGLYKSQLQTLQGRTDGSVSAESGNPSFSKTSKGVAQQEERTNSQDNYLLNKANTASAKMAQKMMNIHMAQMEGADILDIVEDDLERLLKAGYIDDNPMTPEPSAGELPIMYEDLKDTFKFEYDAAPEADDEEKNRWLELIDIATSNPNVIPALEMSGWRFDLGEAFKKVINASGTQDSEKVLVKIEADGASAIDPMTGLPMEDPMMGGLPPEQGQLPEGQLPPELAQVPEMGESELQVTMEEYGVDEQIAQTIMQARSEGFEEDEIIAFLQGAQ
jgi:hypothetical protein